jgi:hypothetical protein
MTLTIPHFITNSNVMGQAVSHKWSQGKAMVALGTDNPAVEHKLGKISLRGLLTLSAGLAEWMQARFLHLNTDIEFEYWIEAFWASSIDPRYLKQNTSKFKSDNSDPVRGPIQECKKSLKYNMELYLEGDIGIVRYVRSLASLVNYVLPNGKPFQVWFKKVVDRLPALSTPSASTSCKLDIEEDDDLRLGIDENIWGGPVPREVLDPTFDLNGADSVKLIDQLLQQINRPDNPFLRSPAELIALGMKGTPYHYPQN